MPFDGQRPERPLRAKQIAKRGRRNQTSCDICSAESVVSVESDLLLDAMKLSPDVTVVTWRSKVAWQQWRINVKEERFKRPEILLGVGVKCCLTGVSTAFIVDQTSLGNILLSCSLSFKALVYWWSDVIVIAWHDSFLHGRFREHLWNKPSQKSRIDLML
jgi:hypothetical protein